jgi:hypothetical protein
MADKKISQLTAATTPLAGTEVLPIVQSGSTVKVSIDNVTKGRTVNATTFDTDVASAGVTLTGVTLSADGTDTNIDINVTPKGTGSVNITKANIDGGTVDGTTIGGASAAAGTFTTATATRLTASGDYAANGGDLTLTNTNGGRSWRLGDGIGGLVGSLVVFDGTGSAIRSSWDSSGNYKIDNGNLVVGTAAKGIDFSANTHAPGMTSELLNWYEEGTWTPTLARSTGGNISATYEVQTGRYIRIGKQVVVNGFISITAIASQGSDYQYIGGLPFAPGDNSVGAISVSRATATGATPATSGYPWSDSRLYLTNTTSGALPISADFVTGYIAFTSTYFV